MHDFTPDAVVALRKRLGMTQDQLAEMMGTTSRSIRRWEAGDLIPPMGVAFLNYIARRDF